MAVSSTNSPPPPPDALDIKVQPGDAILGAASAKDFGLAPERKPASFFGRLFRFAAQVVLIACLGGVAWAAGAYYLSGHSPRDLLKFVRSSDAQQSTERDQMLGQMREMADEIRALKASVDAQDAARGNQVSQANRPDSAQAANGAAIAALVGRVDKLEADLTSKLSQMSEQLANLEKQISASHAAVAARAPAPHVKHEHLHDAFDPNQHPNAIGAPRPLGAAQ